MCSWNWYSATTKLYFWFTSQYEIVRTSLFRRPNAKHNRMIIASKQQHKTITKKTVVYCCCCCYCFFWLYTYVCKALIHWQHQNQLKTIHSRKFVLWHKYIYLYMYAIERKQRFSYCDVWMEKSVCDTQSPKFEHTVQHSIAQLHNTITDKNTQPWNCKCANWSIDFCMP